MLSSKSREHRLRVLENQAKLAADHGSPVKPRRGDPQLKMPLIVEVKATAGTKQRVRRSRGKPRTDQADFGDL